MLITNKHWHFLFVSGKEGFPIRVAPDPPLNIMVPPPFSYLKKLNIPHIYKHIGFDENFYSENGLHTTVAVSHYCMNNRPDAVFICCQYLVGAFDDGLVLKLLSDLKIPVAIMWMDSYSEGYQHRIDNFKKWSYQLIFDNPQCPDFIDSPIKETLYDNDFKKDIDVSFIGNYKEYGGRERYINYLEDKRIGIYKGGGKEWKGESYDSLFKRSKITVNFPWTYDGKSLQLKGRPYEATAAGALLLEGANPLTAMVFREGIDYISFADPEDLAEKVRYFLKNTEEREKIARTGQATCLSKYSMEKWWEKVLTKLNLML